MTSKAGCKITSAVVCDDIRQEINGKAFLIGVYTGSIEVSGTSFEAQLAAALTVEFEREGQQKIEFRTQLDGRHLKTMNAEIMVEKAGEAFLPIPLAFGEIKNSGILSLTMQIEGCEEQVVFKKQVNLHPPPAQT